MFILIFALFPRVETGASDAPNAYITWTDEYLKIDALPHAGWSLPQGGEYHTDNAGLQQLHDALAAYGVTGVVPSWVPEGAVLVMVLSAPVVVLTEIEFVPLLAIFTSERRM